MNWPLVMLLALMLDAVLGWPAPFYRAISHPVVWIGRLITALETRLNRPNFHERRRLWGGAITLVLCLVICTGLALGALAILPRGWIGTILAAVLVWPWVAVRSMYTHVADVARPLEAGNLTGARHAVSMIVGRDPSGLDSPGVARAALESLAENTSDGITAPLFWGALLGLPGIVAYKVINTLDSMIGHRTARYEMFGKAAARLDDLVNLIPARLSGLCFALAGQAPGRALGLMWRDAGQHRSPNAGWPEAALAGALHIRLSGPRSYGTELCDEPWVNADAPDPGPHDLRRGLALYRRAMVAMAGVLAIWALWLGTGG